ncbi:polysaccharide deacetylase family protein, partial [Candidatus Peregrinibacteria bacterium]|nr:polysaccharide deacetylase family protein [Candidatus Peregrinibacteria bacterium]
LHLRVDIDSFNGLKFGVPNLLKLFKNSNVKATFFLTLKREGNIFEYLKYRKFRKNNKNKNNEYPNSILKSKKSRKSEIIRMLLFPNPLYKKNQIINDILSCGHELQIHCSKHVVWNKPSHKEALKDLNEATIIYKRVTGTSPSGFASPYHSWSANIAQVIKNSNIKYISIHHNKDYPYLCQQTNKLNIPITISISEKKIPICEYFALQGYSGKDITKKAIKHIESESQKKEFLSTYIHPRIEGIELFEEFSELIEYLSKNYNLNRTFSDLLNHYDNKTIN